MKKERYLFLTCPTNSDVPAVEASPAGAASSEAEPPVVAAASNAVVLTVTICRKVHMIVSQNHCKVLTASLQKFSKSGSYTFTGSRDLRVMMALPAYTVLTKVSLSCNKKCGLQYV